MGLPQTRSLGIYTGYTAGTSPLDRTGDFCPQIPWARLIVPQMKIPVAAIEREAYLAVIATLKLTAKKNFPFEYQTHWQV